MLCFSMLYPFTLPLHNIFDVMFLIVISVMFFEWKWVVFGVIFFCLMFFTVILFHVMFFDVIFFDVTICDVMFLIVISVMFFEWKWVRSQKLFVISQTADCNTTYKQQCQWQQKTLILKVTPLHLHCELLTLTGLG
jgi:hypothetical protein